MNSQAQYWQNAQGYVSLDRKTFALFQTERKSVSHLFNTLVMQAFTRSIPVEQLDGTFRIWGEGSRPWSMRKLGDAAGLSVNTVRKALGRLHKLNLIRLVSNKRGTVIQVIEFAQYRKRNPNKDLVPVFDRTTNLTHQGDTPYPKSDHYRSLSNTTYRSLPNSVTVTKPALVLLEVEKEETPEDLERGLKFLPKSWRDKFQAMKAPKI